MPAVVRRGLKDLAAAPHRRLSRVLARRWLPVAREGQRASLDPLGVLLFAAAVLLALLPVVEGSQGQPLSERPWWLLGVSGAVLAAFLLWEVWWTRRGRETLVDLELPRHRVCLQPFRLASRPVSNREWCAFIPLT